MDVVNIFLQGELDEVYLVQNPGFKSSMHPTSICRLKASLRPQAGAQSMALEDHSISESSSQLKNVKIRQFHVHLERL